MLFFFLALLPGLGFAECSKENREKAVSSGIDPKVVKILCGDSLEEDYVFEVKPPQKKKNLINPLEDNISSYTANPHPVRVGPGVPGPRREIHDDPLENLGKNNGFLWRPRECSGRDQVSGS